MINNNFKNKVILVEKPLSNKKITKLSNKNKIFTAYNLRFNPVIQELKKIVTKNNFYFASVKCHSYLPNWRKIDYRLTYSANKSMGGGVVFDLSHEIDYSHYLFGKIIIINKFNNKISNLEINSDDILLFSGKSFKVKNIFISLNYFSKFEERKIILWGDKIEVEADLNKKYLKIKKNNKIKTIRFKYEALDSYKEMHKNIIKKNYKLLPSIEESLKLNNFLINLKT